MSRDEIEAFLDRAIDAGNHCRPCNVIRLGLKDYQAQIAPLLSEAQSQLSGLTGEERVKHTLSAGDGL